MSESKGAILVLTYNRSNLLHDLLLSINECLEAKGIPLLVVRQLGDDNVRDVLEIWRTKIDVLIEMDGSGRSVPDNIGRNRLAGYSTAFDALGVDWVLAVEEDVVLARDTIAFVKFVIEKFQNKRNFRGINLGSRLKNSNEGNSSFCKTRYGIFGQAAVMPSSSWRRMQKLRVIQSSRSGHWDSAMEAYMKSGLTISPNNSRYIDRGWNGAHSHPNPQDPYYQDLVDSFVSDVNDWSANYHELDLGYWWRSDMRKFHSLFSPHYWFIFFIQHPKNFRFLKDLRTWMGKKLEV